MTADSDSPYQYVNGHFYVSDENVARTLRYQVFNWLDTYKDKTKIESFARRMDGWSEVGLEPSTSYEFTFVNLPHERYEAIRKVWVGEDAIYPYTVGVCAAKTRNPKPEPNYN